MTSADPIQSKTSPLCDCSHSERVGRWNVILRHKIRETRRLLLTLLVLFVPYSSPLCDWTHMTSTVRRGWEVHRNATFDVSHDSDPSVTRSSPCVDIGTSDSAVDRVSSRGNGSVGPNRWMPWRVDSHYPLHRPVVSLS